MSSPSYSGSESVIMASPSHWHSGSLLLSQCDSTVSVPGDNVASAAVIRVQTVVRCTVQPRSHNIELDIRILYTLY